MLNPTHQSIRKGDLETLKKLLAAGAEVNELEDGFSLLETAGEYAYFEIAKFLLDNGATIYRETRTNNTVGQINNSQPLFEVVFAAENFYKKIQETSDEQKKQALNERYEDCFKIFELILRHEKIFRQQHPEQCKGIAPLIGTYKNRLTTFTTINVCDKEIKARFLGIHKKIREEFAKPKSIEPEAETDTSLGLHKRKVKADVKTDTAPKCKVNSKDSGAAPEILSTNRYSLWNRITSLFSGGSAEVPEDQQPLLHKSLKAH